ncbi:MAG: beta-N-acetylhexosaminidase [Nitrospira sp.]|nr:beta-N-acetylhexosaminidase [Nitrospira sp.]MCP9443338.1 beta-N-acetylhexosaminidase [Nitrospira sp.]
MSRDTIGQFFMIGFDGTDLSSDLAAFLKEYRPGGVIVFARNLQSIEQIVELTNALQRCSPQAPLLIAIDQEGGRVSRLPPEFTIFPPCEILGRCRSSDLAYAVATATARELRAVGINMNMAPVLDVNSNPANPVIGDRAFGSTAELVRDLGWATARGLQDNGVIACGKHFPGHGDTVADSHHELPIVTASRQRLERLELLPFRHAASQGIATMMTAHVLYHALDETLPATLSPAVIGTLLRQELRYDGVVLTDDLEMRAIIDHYGIEEATVRSVEAGCDLVLICKDRNRQVAAIEALDKAIADGTISTDRLTQSLERIGRLKQRFLASSQPAVVSDAKSVVGCPAHQALLHSIDQGAERLA